MKIKIITKYILKEMVGPFFVGFILFTLIFLSDKMTELTDLVINCGVGIFTTLQLLIFIMPAFLAITMPMGVLVGVMVAFNRLNSDNEIIAMKISGIHIRTLIFPVLTASLIGSFIMIGWNNYVLPWGNSSFKNLVYKITSERASLAIQQKVFVSDFDKFVFYVDEKDDKNTFKNIIVFTQETENEPSYFISAKTGSIHSDPMEKAVYLRLEDGTFHQANPKERNLYSRIKFNSYDINLDLKNKLAGMVSNEKSAREMDLTELGSEITKSFQKGINTNNLKVEYHKKIAIPFACTAFTIIGIALGISIRVKGRSLSFLISLVLILFYYFLLIAGEITGSGGLLIPWLAMWLPNIITCIAGVILLYLSIREKISL
ncbi:MAG: LPS export ABC transporter permease LptF [Candidatus Firestonebacteria bacterium RIFOXYC2_FULL_39_67]|nr:MAG: LPS export ABC transporter permease LptF [Candidatus Firestonebacteria bacterium RIFOXYD2_FULL_39_29]OGF53386.1 MAG: LPS export ABC transporter permease LptF [Candidatus Firestonebacteria bacterium RIFOXYC2_FULL_39_67]